MTSSSQGLRDLTAMDGFDSVLPRIKAVAFDLDGTLCDSIPQIISCTSLTFKSFGLDKPNDDAIRATIGLELEEALRRMLPDPMKSRAAEVTAEYRRIFITHPELQIDALFPGVVELMQALKSRGLKIGFISGRSKRGILRTVENTALKDFCDAVAAGDEAPSKPDPEVMYLWCERVGVRPSQVLGVGDSAMDIELCHNAGAYSLGVQSGVLSGEGMQGMKKPPRFMLPAVGMLRDYL